MSDSLQSQSLLADQQYNLLPGTTYAIAGTESNYGQNLGSRGNIFQFGQAETQQYGSGNDPMSAASYFSTLLNGPANGNYAVAYTMYQNGATGYANGNTTPQYSSTSPFASFLQSIGYGPSGSDVGPASSVTTPNGITAGTISAADANSSSPADTTGFGSYIDPTGSGYITGPSGVTVTPAGDQISPSGNATGGAQAAGQSAGQATTSALSWLTKWLPSPLQISGGLLALIIIVVGLVALILDKKPVEVAVNAAKKAIA